MTAGSIRIRNANTDDAAVIADFNARLALESEATVLDQETILAGVTSLLRDPAKGRYWIATVGAAVAGQIMVTWEWSDWRNGMYWWIQSVYVDPDFRRKGVFSALYRHVESLAMADAEACGIRLYVEHNNGRAIDTYESLGMTLSGHQVMQSIFAERS